MASQLARQAEATERLINKIEGMTAAASGPEIRVSSTPKHMQITQTMIEDMLFNPVLGIKVMFGEDIDAFQAVRAKICWNTPRVMDSSGLSSAKTINLWWTFNLRCLLMQGRIAAVYYPSWGQGQKAFWKYYQIYLKKSPIFRAQVGRMAADFSKQEGKAQVKGPSCWTMEYKNGSQIILPAPGFLQDSKTQSGLRFNDLGIDEINKIAAMGSTGIDDQLIGRTTMEVFNKDNPIWANKHLFLSTAEDTMHPGYERYKNFLSRSMGGDKHTRCSDFATFSFCFKDYSDLPGSDGRPFKIYREDNVMRDMKMNKSRSSYLQEALGIWSDNGKAFYAQEYIDNAYRYGMDRRVTPVTSRPDDYFAQKNNQCYYFMGADPAKADTAKADDGALVILRATPKADKTSNEPRDWNLDFVWAYRVRKADAPQWAGIIHKKVEHFRLDGIMLDPGGGGMWIRPELKKSKQVIEGIERDVIPIACPEDEQEMPTTGKFILSMFKIMDTCVQRAWGSMQLANIDNLYDVIHSEFQEAWALGLFSLPPKVRDMPRSEVATWSAEKLDASNLIDLMAKQITSINVKTDENGGTKFTKNGAKQFVCKGKKDFAYAAMYSYAKFLTWLREHDDELSLQGEDEAMVF